MTRSSQVLAVMMWSASLLSARSSAVVPPIQTPSTTESPDLRGAWLGTLSVGVQGIRLGLLIEQDEKVRSPASRARRTLWDRCPTTRKTWRSLRPVGFDSQGNSPIRAVQGELPPSCSFLAPARRIATRRPSDIAPSSCSRMRSRGAASPYFDSTIAAWPARLVMSSRRRSMRLRTM
jgi:hypothetical protein